MKRPLDAEEQPNGKRKKELPQVTVIHEGCSASFADVQQIVSKMLAGSSAKGKWPSWVRVSNPTAVGRVVIVGIPGPRRVDLRIPDYFPFLNQHFTSMKSMSTFPMHARIACPFVDGVLTMPARRKADTSRRITHPPINRYLMSEEERSLNDLPTGGTPKGWVCFDDVDVKNEANQDIESDSDGVGSDGPHGVGEEADAWQTVECRKFPFAVLSMDGVDGNLEEGAEEGEVCEPGPSSSDPPPYSPPGGPPVNPISGKPHPPVDPAHYMTFRPDPDLPLVLGLDCEMVETEGGSSEVCRVSVVNFQGEAIYDELVLPSLPITDYRTPFSGIAVHHLKNVTKTLKDVWDDLRKFWTPRSIIVGHSLENDLSCLRIRFSRIIDTSSVFPLKYPLKHKLSHLVRAHLRDKLDRSAGHDSIDDARASLRLFLLKLVKGWDFSGVPDVPLCRFVSSLPPPEALLLVDSQQYRQTYCSSKFFEGVEKVMVDGDDEVIGRLIDGEMRVCVGVLRDVEKLQQRTLGILRPEGFGGVYRRLVRAKAAGAMPLRGEDNPDAYKDSTDGTWEERIDDLPLSVQRQFLESESTYQTVVKERLASLEARAPCGRADIAALVPSPPSDTLHTVYRATSKRLIRLYDSLSLGDVLIVVAPYPDRQRYQALSCLKRRLRTDDKLGIEWTKAWEDELNAAKHTDGAAAFIIIKRP